MTADGGSAGALATIRRAGVVAVLRGTGAAEAVDVAHRLMGAGMPVIEVAFTNPGAAQAIAVLTAEGDGVLVGAGTVLTRHEAEAAVGAGARFLVSPAFTEAVAEVSRQSGIPYVPGVFTASEVATALAAGCSTLKLFPARIAGPTGMNDLADPFPRASFLASGIDAADIGTWLRAGAVAVALGGYLTRAEDPAGRAAEVLGAVARARQGADVPAGGPAGAA